MRWQGMPGSTRCGLSPRRVMGIPSEAVIYAGSAARQQSRLGCGQVLVCVHRQGLRSGVLHGPCLTQIEPTDATLVQTSHFQATQTLLLQATQLRNHQLPIWMGILGRELESVGLAAAPYKPVTLVAMLTKSCSRVWPWSDRKWPRQSTAA